MPPLPRRHLPSFPRGRGARLDTREPRRQRGDCRWNRGKGQIGPALGRLQHRGRADLATAFILPVFTAFFAQLLVRAQVVRQILPPLPAGLRSSAFSERPWIQRGTLLGLGAMGAVAVPVIAGLALSAPRSSPSGFIWFKATFAAALGALVTPLLGWWALQEASREAADPPGTE